jgi:cytochrome c-type biogenesis protein CcmH
MTLVTVVTPVSPRGHLSQVRRAMRWLSVLAVMALVALPTLARADALDEGVRRVGLQLQCPVCEGETVADSPSGLATDMRGVIRTKLAAGETDQQILDDFVASYGDSILTEPPKRGISLGVWIGPIIGVALGALLVTTLLRTWRRAPAPAAGGPQAVDADVVDEFHRFREELYQGHGR